MYLPILNEDHSTFHLQYNHSGPFANRKYGELSYPKNQKMCVPILVTLLEMRPHYSQSSHENETPSCSTSPLASYKEVSPPLPPGHWPPLCITCSQRQRHVGISDHFNTHFM